MTEQILWEIFETIVSSVEIIIHTWFFRKNAYRFRKGTAQVVLGNVLLVAILFLCDKVEIFSSLKLLFIMAASAVTYWYLLEIEIHKVIICVICCMAAIIFSEAAGMGILACLHGYQNFEIFIGKNFYRIECVILSKVIYIFFLYCALHLIKREKKSYWKKELLLFVLQSFTSMLVVLMAGDISVAADGKQAISPYFCSILAFFALLAYMVSFWVTENYFASQELLQETIRIDAYRKRKEDYIALQEEAQERVRRIYHDLKNHMAAMHRLQGSDMELLESYMKEINQTVADYERFYSSGCDVLDMMLLDKQECAQKEGIHFDVRMEDNCLQEFAPFLLCTIFGNALDNALEANMNRAIQDKFIRVRIQHMGKNISILIENSCAWLPCQNEKGRFVTRKKDAKMHGIGMKNIEDAVKRCNGNTEVRYQENKFCLFILLCPAKDSELTVKTEK